MSMRKLRPYKRSLLVSTLCIGLLGLALVIDARLTQHNSLAHSPGSLLTAHAGPYTVALSITPNPPSATQPVHLALRITDTSTGLPVNDAGVQLQGRMESMEMLTRALYANPQGNGLYTIDTTLLMSGSWRFEVSITRLNMPPASTQFIISSQ